MGRRSAESLAHEFLDAGIGSAIAMTHSVTVATSQELFSKFYPYLACGLPVSDSFHLARKSLRSGNVPSNGRVAPEGTTGAWFVPVLFQRYDYRVLVSHEGLADDDPALHSIEVAQPTGGAAHVLAHIGRDREILELERLLGTKKVVVLQGTIGEGKLALARECGRWLASAGRIEKEITVVVEDGQTVSDLAESVAAELASSAGAEPRGRSARSSADRLIGVIGASPILVVLGRVERLLGSGGKPSGESGVEVGDCTTIFDELLRFCTEVAADPCVQWILTTSIGVDVSGHHDVSVMELGPLEEGEARELAMEVVQMNVDAGGDTQLEALDEEVSVLIEALACHAGSILCAAPILLQKAGGGRVLNIREYLGAAIDRGADVRARAMRAELERAIGFLDPSVLAYVHELAPFASGASLGVLGQVIEHGQDAAEALVAELQSVGLAGAVRLGHARLHPCLIAYLRGSVDQGLLDKLDEGWREAMGAFISAFSHPSLANVPENVTRMMSLEVPNCRLLLESLLVQGDDEQALRVAISATAAFGHYSDRAFMAFVASVRSGALPEGAEEWGLTHFLAEHARLEELHFKRDSSAAAAGGVLLIDQARRAEDLGGKGADVALAIACLAQGRYLGIGLQDCQAALPFLHEARARLESREDSADGAVGNLLGVCNCTEADCYVLAGEYDRAAGIYDAAINAAHLRGNKRGAAVAAGQLGTLMLRQGRPVEAARAHRRSIAFYEVVGDPLHLGVAHHNLGVALASAGNMRDAEEAFRKSLIFSTAAGDSASQADSLLELSQVLSSEVYTREEALAFSHDAAKLYAKAGDRRAEAHARYVRAIQLAGDKGRADGGVEALEEADRAAALALSVGSAARPWLPLLLLGRLQSEAGDDEGAVTSISCSYDQFLTHRRAGGSATFFSVRVCDELAEMLLEGQTDVALAVIKRERVASPSAKEGLLLDALELVVRGGVDLSKLGLQRFDPWDAAEVHYFVERLNR
jgi:tetratricopeptide (TPR) repeat protein